MERKGTADVIGYCGLIIHGNGSPDEPELAYETSVEVHPYESKYLPLTQAQRDRDQPARVEPVTRRRSQNSRLRSKGHAWRGAGENSA